MNTPKAIITAALILSGTMLLSAHYIAVGLMANAEHSTYEWASARFGSLLPVGAWLCFGICGLFVLQMLVKAISEKIVAKNET